MFFWLLIERTVFFEIHERKMTAIFEIWKEKEREVVERELEVATRDAVLCERKYALDKREAGMQREERVSSQESVCSIQGDVDIQMEDAKAGTEGIDTHLWSVEEPTAGLQDHDNQTREVPQADDIENSVEVLARLKEEWHEARARYWAASEDADICELTIELDNGKNLKLGAEHVDFQAQVEKLEEENGGLRRRVFLSPYGGCSPLEGGYIAPSGTLRDAGEPIRARGGNDHVGYQSIKQQLDLLMEEGADLFDMSPDAYAAQSGVMVGSDRPDNREIYGDDGELGGENGWEDEVDGGHSDLGEHGSDEAGDDNELVVPGASSKKPYQPQVEGLDDEDLIYD